jgi:hypothetical protein
MALRNERVVVTTGLARMEGEIAMYIRASDNSPAARSQAANGQALLQATGHTPSEPGPGRGCSRIGRSEPELTAELLGAGGQVAQPAAPSIGGSPIPLSVTWTARIWSGSTSTLTSTSLAFA